jgi:hypothetical protein
VTGVASLVSGLLWEQASWRRYSAAKQARKELEERWQSHYGQHGQGVDRYARRDGGFTFVDMLSRLMNSMPFHRGRLPC